MCIVHRALCINIIIPVFGAYVKVREVISCKVHKISIFNIFFKFAIDKHNILCYNLYCSGKYSGSELSVYLYRQICRSENDTF